MTEISDDEAAEVLWASSEAGRAAVRAAHRKFLGIHPGNLDVSVADLAAVVYAAIRAAKPPGDVRDAVARSHEANRAAGLRAGDHPRNAPLPGSLAAIKSRADLIDDLTGLDYAGALGGIRAIIAERLRQVRDGEDLSHHLPFLAVNAIEGGRLGEAAALLAAAIDRQEQQR